MKYATFNSAPGTDNNKNLGTDMDLTLAQIGKESLASDPAGFAKDFATGVAKDILTSALDHTEEHKLPPSPVNTDEMANYYGPAIKEWQVGQNRAFTPYNDGDVTWTGDPYFYGKQGTPADFTQYFSDGDVDMKTLKQHPAALDAYNAWLHDPTVQRTIYPKVSASEAGQLSQEGH